jgi:hypothetical protein
MREKMMKFTPREDEYFCFTLEPGEYDFKIIQAEDAVSKTNNEMIKLSLKVWGKDGQEYYITDYLLTNNARMEWKLKNFCDSVGLSDKYLSGELNAADCKDKHAKVELRIDKDKEGKYPDKNSVKKYVQTLLPPMADKNNFVDDDIPFI